MHRNLVVCMGGVLVLLLVRHSPAADPNEFLARTYAEADTGLQLPYRLFKPIGYDPARQYPLVLFLHGAGERGADNQLQVNGNIDNLLAHLKMPDYSGFLLAPQTSSGWAAWGSEPVDAMRMSLGVVGQLASEFSIDPTRLYVTGLSMGGHGTWEVTWQRQGLFAAAVPICGYGDTTKAGLMTHAPLWAFHAADDSVVPIEGSRNMIAAIRAAGGSPFYTEYATGGHGIWGYVYNQPQLYQWMFAQKVSTLVWDTSTASGYQGGDGTWGINSHWSAGGTPGPWSVGSAVRFAASGGPWTITVSGAQNVHSMIFDGSGYTLSGGTLNLDGTGSIMASQDATIASVIQGSCGLSKTGAGVLRLAGANTFTGITRVGGGTLEVAHPLALQNSILDLDSAYGGTFRIATTTATLAGLKGSRGLTLPNSFTLSVGNGGVTSSYSGSLDGSGGLAKIGMGVFTLTASSSYTGVTTLRNGVLRLNHASALPGGILPSGGRSSLTLDGGILGLASGNFGRALGSGAEQVQWAGSGGFAAFSTDRSVNLGGASATVVWGQGGFVPDGSALVLGAATADRNLIFLNPVDLGDQERTIHVYDGTASVDGTLAGALRGGGAVIKSGSGMLTVAGNNAVHSGGWNVQEGGIAVSNITALGSGPLNLGSNTTLRVTGYSAFSMDKTVLLSGNATFDIQNTVGASVLGEIRGTGRLTKSGSGALTLAHANPYAGTMEILAGSLLVKHPQALQSATLSTTTSATVNFSGVSQATLGNLQGSGNLSLPGNFTLTVGGNQADVVYGGRISGTGATLIKTGSGCLRLASSQNYSGTTVIAEGTLQLAPRGTPGLYEGSAAGWDTSRANPGGSVVLTTRMANTTANWPTSTTYFYSGYLNNFTASNVTWTFAEQFDDNVYLRVDDATVLNNTVWNSQTSGSVTLSPGSHAFMLQVCNVGGAAGPFAGGVDGMTGLGVAYKTAATGSWLPLTDPGNGDLFTLSDAGSSGNVLPLATVLQLGGAAGNPTLDLNGVNQQVASVADYAGDFQGSIANSSTKFATLTLSSASGSSVFSGVIRDAVNLVKNGGGTQILAGANSYTGHTTVNAGTLVVNGSLAGSLTVNNGAMLGGTGTLRAVAVNSGGHLSPGNPNGTLLLTGNLTLASGALLDFDLGPPAASDNISMPAQALTLGSGLQLANFAFHVQEGFGPGQYVLIDAGAIQGSIIPQSGIVGGRPVFLAIDRVHNDVVLTVVPEPSMIVLLCVAATGLVAFGARGTCHRPLDARNAGDGRCDE